jgi:group I intron endonuclease
MGNRSKTRSTYGVAEKECTKCAEWKPANLEHFASFKEGVMGLHPWCRDCHRQYSRDKAARTGKPIRKILSGLGAPPKVQNPMPVDVAGMLVDITRKIDDRAPFKAYLITNKLTGQNYIGITERKLKDRWKQHLMDGTRGGGYLLHKAMHKDGIENFSFEFVACSIDRHSLNLLEVQLIDQHRSVELGYNQTRGGSAGESVGTEITVGGKAFISISSAARQFGVDEDTAFQRLSRHGWTPEQAFGVDPAPPRKTRISLFEVDGGTHDNFVAACSAYGLEDSTVRRRMTLQWSLRQAFGLDAPPVRTNSTGNSITVSGQVFPSLMKAAEHHGAHRHTVAKRIKAGQTPEQAFGLTPTDKLEREGNTIEVNGIIYRSIESAAATYGVSSKLAAAHLRKGWTTMQAFGLAEPMPRKVGNAGSQIQVDGISYTSHAQAAKALGLNPKIIHSRLKHLGWTIDQAFGIAPPPAKRANSAKKLLISGQWFEAIADACAAYGITQSAVNRRIANGMTLEEAVTKPSGKSKNRK